MMSFFRLVREVQPLQRGLLPQSATAIFLGSSTLRYVSSKRRLLREAMVLGSGSNVSSWDHLGSISPLATISMNSANASLAGGGMEVELLNDTHFEARHSARSIRVSNGCLAMSMMRSMQNLPNSRNVTAPSTHLTHTDTERRRNGVAGPMLTAAIGEVLTRSQC